jgi:hypothetical protein
VGDAGAWTSAPIATRAPPGSRAADVTHVGTETNGPKTPQPDRAGTAAGIDRDTGVSCVIRITDPHAPAGSRREEADREATTVSRRDLLTVGDQTGRVDGGKPPPPKISGGWVGAYRNIEGI